MEVLNLVTRGVGKIKDKPYFGDMKNHLTYLLLLLLGSISVFAQPDPGSLGPQSQGWYTETVTRDSRTMNCRIYYPSLSKGENYYGTFAFGDSVAAETSVIIETTVGVNDEIEDIPTGFTVSQNYPNPFNPVSRVEITLPVSGFVTVKIYGIAGEIVGPISEGYFERGSHSFEIDAGALGLSSGVYIYSITAVGENDSLYTGSRKFIVLK